MAGWACASIRATSSPPATALDAADYRATMRQFNRIVGIDQIRAFHLNDSLKDCGSRVDRHAHIGCGKIGLDAFGWLLRDRRFRKLPMVLETPKGTENGENLDIVNLRKLREAAGSPLSSRPSG